MATIAFREAHREVQGLTAGVEKRALAALVERLPAWVQSDHLTALGLVATLGAGLAYALSRQESAWLHVVNLCLLLNWYGDSLDGTVARHRRCERPRYGFYVDHIIDALGAACVIGGLALSGLMSAGVAAVLLIAYYLVAIHVYLTTYTAGTFKISYGPLGGTELRIVLAAANLAALRWPQVSWFGATVRLFDICGVAAALGLAAILVVFVPKVSQALREQDGAAPKDSAVARS